MCRFVGERYLHFKSFNFRRNCEAIHLNLAKLDVSERRKKKASKLLKHLSGEQRFLLLTARIKFHLLFAGIISSPFSPRLQDKG